MTDRPILFSAPMVRALLEGRKTQTRRVLKPQIVEAGDGWAWNGRHSGVWATSLEDVAGSVAQIGAPYAPGDRLWVKETWRAAKVADKLKPSQLAGPGLSRIWYEADRDNCDQHGKVRVSIHMPRWASRLTLLVTGVRVERLQDISEADAIAEGVQFRWWPIDAYRDLWNEINGPGAWDANPWVVAVTFTVEQRNINA